MIRRIHDEADAPVALSRRIARPTHRTPRWTTPCRGVPPFIRGMKRKVPRELVAQRAYALWLADGCRDGQSLRHWLSAEEQVREELGIPERPTGSDSRLGALSR